MSAKKNILITDRFSLSAASLLKAKSQFHVVLLQNHTPTKEELAQANALIIRSRTKIFKEVLDLAPDLEAIITATSGYDHIDFEETQKRKVKVFHTPEANAQSTAELTLLLMLSCARQTNLAQKMIQNAEWKRDSLSCFELAQKSLGIIGLGRVGSRVAKLAHAFGMQVYAYDPYKDDEHFQNLQVQRLGYTEILRMSNIITYHVPYTKETHQMLNRRLFEDLTEGVTVINASRGDVINEQDLLYGLDMGLIARAGLDVYSKEPLPKNSSLINHPKIITLPHLGATTSEAFEQASLGAAQKCIAFFEGQSVTDELPPEAPWWKYEFRRST